MQPNVTVATDPRNFNPITRPERSPTAQVEAIVEAWRERNLDVPRLARKLAAAISGDMARLRSQVLAAEQAKDLAALIQANAAYRDGDLMLQALAEVTP